MQEFMLEVAWRSLNWHHVCLSRNTSADSFSIISDGKVLKVLKDSQVPDREIILNQFEIKIVKEMYGSVSDFQLWNKSLQGKI
jgi:hypothetical protein